MYSERLQLLLSKEQRARLEREARERDQSVASIVREAIDARYRVTPDADRRSAVERIRSMRVPAPTIDELETLIEQRFDSEQPPTGETR